MFIAEKWGCLYLYLDVKSEQPTYSLNTSQYIRINPNLVKTSNVVTILVRQTKKNVGQDTVESKTYKQV